MGVPRVEEIFTDRHGANVTPGGGARAVTMRVAWGLRVVVV